VVGSPRRRESHAERRERRAAVDDLDTVLEAAARFLESRSRSVGEVRRRLITAGYRPALVEDAITRLIELGFLDDEAFASAWVESRDRAHPRGEHALRRELGQKGIERAVVDEVLAARRGDGQGDDPVDDGAEPPDPDRDAALRLLDRRRSALLREPDPQKRRQKAYALLARNGFAPDVASEVSRQVADPADADDG
jgi:regulatory protein